MVRGSDGKVRVVPMSEHISILDVPATITRERVLALCLRLAAHHMNPPLGGVQNAQPSAMKDQ